MDKVLIVDNDTENLKKVREGFRGLHHFELLTATSAHAAAEVLAKSRISVLATNVHLPRGDGLDLLAFMTRTFPSIPCIVMLEPDDPKPWFIDRTGHTGVLYYLKKPFSFGRLASAIFVGLNLRDEGQTRNGMAMRNFLPLVAIARKTCRMEVRSGTRQKGIFYFEDGRLLNARLSDRQGDAAAKEIAEWRGIQLRIAPLAPEDRVLRVQTDLLDLARATWEKGARPAKEASAAAVSPPHHESGVDSRLEKALQKHAGSLKTARGYKGLAIINSEGKVLASDIPPSAGMDFSALAVAAISMLTDCSRHLSRRGLGACRGLSLHTDSGVVIIGSTDPYESGSYRYLALMAEEGNCYFMHMQLKTLMPRILAELG